MKVKFIFLFETRLFEWSYVVAAWTCDAWNLWFRDGLRHANAVLFLLTEGDDIADVPLKKKADLYISDWSGPRKLTN